MKNIESEDIENFLSNHSKDVLSFILKSSVAGKTNNKLVEKYYDIAIFIVNTFENNEDPTYEVAINNAISRYVLKEKPPRKQFNF
jgi:hypothetical protein